MVENMQMHFRKLQIWQRSMRLAKAIYGLTDDFPSNEQFGLTSQIRRAAISIPSNIAEGSQRGTDKDFAHFLLIAKGSIAEVETQLLLAQELAYVDAAKVDALVQEIGELDRMIHALHAKLLS